MRLFLIVGISIATTAMAASDQPKIDGRVNAVSASDVRHICAAARDWLHSTPDFARRFGQRISLIHIVSADKAEVHVGRADMPPRGYFVGGFISVERRHGVWKAGDATVVGADTLR